MPKLDATHAQYDEFLPIWQKIEDCDKGEYWLKQRDLAEANSGTGVYILKPNPSDISEENLLRYRQYIARASYVNFTARTLSGLVGQVTAKDPEIKIPTAIEQLIEDIDGSGVSLEQQYSKALRYGMGHGRCGLLVDFPQTEGPTRRDRVLSGEVRPTITLYSPLSIDLWRTERRGSKDVYTLIKLRESRTVVDPEDEFKESVITIYRVLKLDEDGRYFQQIWREANAEELKANDGEKWVQEGGDVYPLKESGQPWDEIPFTFIGSVNNDSEVDPAPMADIANVNIAHYRNSADYEESSYQVGQPTPVYSIGEITVEQWEKLNPGGPKFGSLGGIGLGKGGSATLLQPEPNMIPKEAMQHKEEQMAMLGARLIKPNDVAITATQASIDNASEGSVLAKVTRNVSAAYRKALTWMREFLRGAESTEITFELNNDFAAVTLDAQTLTALVSAWQQGAISKTVLHGYVQRSGFEENSFEDAEDEINDNPAPIELTTPANRVNDNSQNPE